MTLPGLPTDNLYKFVALAGLVIFFYGMTTPFVFLNHNLDKIESVAQEAASLSADVHVLKNSLEVDPVKPGDAAEARKRIEQSADAARRNAVLGEKLNMVRRLNQQDADAGIIGFIVAIIGLLVSTLGFCLWYIRVQVYQDIELRGRITQTVEGKQGSECTSFKNRP